MHWSCPEIERVACALRSAGERVTVTPICLLLWSGSTRASRMLAGMDGCHA